MTTRRIARSCIPAALILISIATEALAQLSKSSGGITISISKVLVSGQSVIIQFDAKNNTKGRVYIRDAKFDERQKAFLGSGAHLNWPEITGLELCADTVARCVNPASNPDANNLNDYAYIEAGDFMSFSFDYQAPSPPNQGDTISFGVDMVVRYSQPDGNPQEAGPMQAVRQNFSYIPLSHH